MTDGLKLLQEYFDNKDALETLQKEVDRLKDEVTAYINSQPEKKAILPGVATFGLRRYFTYEYSPVVENMELEVKARKKMEEEAGTAKVATEKFSPVMNKIKEK